MTESLPMGEGSQVDYRSAPSFGSTGSQTDHLDGYDQPTEPNAVSAAPATDQSWKGFDSVDDATRFNGINAPAHQADLHAEPDPVNGSQGFSPGLSDAIERARKVSGAPPA